MRPMCLVKVVFFLSMLTLFACTGPNVGTVIYQGNSLPEQTLENVERVENNAIVRARIIADILFEAAYALDDNKLLLPAGDNAYDRYLEVLSVEPANAVALAGIQNIVLRYVELADGAMAIGQYDEAEKFLERGASIEPASDSILAARSRLVLARTVEINFVELDPDGLNDQTLETMLLLSEIAESVKLAGATVLITARTDAEGRWIYKTMRESLGGYRLRGDIVLGNQPGIQINSPGA